MVILLVFLLSFVIYQTQSFVHENNFTLYRWLHIPKTGSSFGNVLVHFLCPAIPENVTASCEKSPLCHRVTKSEVQHSIRKLRVGYPHGPIVVPFYSRMYPAPKYCSNLKSFERIRQDPSHLPLPLSNIAHFVTMLRHPLRRSLSAYNVGHLPIAHPKLQWQVWQLNQTEFISHKAVQNCQLKMLAHIGCSSTKHITKQELSVAKRNLEVLAFFGITELWELSVKLFHAMLGGKLLESDLRNIKSAAYNENDIETLKQCIGMENQLEISKLEYQLFEFACDLFVERLVKHSIIEIHETMKTKSDCLC